MNQINASIVLYHNEKAQLKKVISSFLDTDLKVKLYLIDNSSNDKLKELKDMDSRIEYVFNNENLGYGRAHNIALKKSIEKSTPYHIVLNPDICFDSGVLQVLYKYMEENYDIGNIMPQVKFLVASSNVKHVPAKKKHWSVV